MVTAHHLIVEKVGLMMVLLYLTVQSSVCVYSAGGPVNIAYIVFFMRKLWFNVVPGRDTEADLIFHFPQVHLNKQLTFSSLAVFCCFISIHIILPGTQMR